jgi:hypothetical protein
VEVLISVTSAVIGYNFQKRVLIVEGYIRRTGHLLQGILRRICRAAAEAAISRQPNLPIVSRAKASDRRLRPDARVRIFREARKAATILPNSG